MENTDLVTSRKAIITLLKYSIPIFQKKKKSIEIKDGCKFVKIIKENL